MHHPTLPVKISNMKKTCILLITLLLFLQHSNAQWTDPKMMDYHPVTPSAFQFLKYTEMPVSEFTGVPDISIPLYEINEDGLSIPVRLSYHAGGIRVSQEASWVGLGWDMNFGCIIQQVNDRDDYDPATIRKQPDWQDSPVPSVYQQKYVNPVFGILSEGWNDVMPVLPPKGVYSWKWYSEYPISVSSPGPYFGDGFTATAWYVPINGFRDNQPLTTDMINVPAYDSDPDIFTASFLGHTIRFMRNPENFQIIVLNKRGYVVTRTNDVYRIMVPSGEEYYFEKNTNVNAYSATLDPTGGNSSSTEVAAKIWMLTKIITKNKREIIFTYHESGMVKNYPAYSTKWNTSVQQVGASLGNDIYNGYTNFPIGLSQTFSYSEENRFTPTGISFPNGQVTFQLSDRNDLLGGKKVDRVIVAAGPEHSRYIKAYQLNYTYWDASAIGGSKNQPSNIADYGNTPNLRLKLLSVTDELATTEHLFTYDETPLPPKNSMAQDYWGFYNGVLTNYYLIPNPARLGPSQLCGSVNLPDNGSNNSANPATVQAGTLTAIKYPTGGKINFEYELNTFNNYLVPDFNSTTNTFSTGNGLRVRFINYQAADNVNSKRTLYTYTGGKASQPVQMCRMYSISIIQSPASTAPQMITHTLCEFNAHGFFSSNPLGSGNYVGYDKVTRYEYGDQGAVLGRTETEFNNYPDRVNISGNSSSAQSAALPAIKYMSSTIPHPSYSDYAESGSAKTVLVYDDQNNLLQRTDNQYTTSVSNPMFYGARFFPNESQWFRVGTQNVYYAHTARVLTGYYPIFDIESLLTNTIVTNYAPGQTDLVTSEILAYDGYHQLNHKQRRSSTGEYIEEIFDHAYDHYQQTGNTSLWSNNWLTEITSYRLERRRQNYSNPIETSGFDKRYNIAANGAIVADKITVKNRSETVPAVPDETIITYDTYANPLSIKKADKIQYLVWDYNAKYVTAEITQDGTGAFAYTSFESGNQGNWQYNVPSPHAAAPTGAFAYNLGNGAVSASINYVPVYIVSYWKAPGSSVNVNLPGTLTTGRELNGWTYCEHRITPGVLDNYISVSGTGFIDELRLHGERTQMTTYTLQPLLGLTSKCDPANRITYYEYDFEGRLSVIRDQDKNILKKFCYNYAGMPEDCPTEVVYGSTAQSKIFTRQNCPTGYTPGTVTYTVPAGAYTSTISQQIADDKAIFDMNEYGQAYANANGSCTPVASPAVTVSLTNTFKLIAWPPSITLEFWQGTTKVQTNNFPSTKTGTVNISIPPGTYTLRFVIPSRYAGSLIYFKLNNPIAVYTNDGSGVVVTGDRTFTTGLSYSISANDPK
jgi:YD repeat-containing protein